jgi:hypothetical protein
MLVKVLGPVLVGTLYIYQFLFGGAANPLRVRKCFGQVRPSGFQEFLLVNFPSHLHLSPASWP